VAKLNRELAETERRKEQLEREYQECSVQLERAKQLIVNLGGEKGRWVQLADQLHDDFDKLTGDVLVSAGVIAYLGGYTAAFRRDITSLWFDKVQRSNIPCSNLYSIDRVLGSPVEIRRWQMNGLPSDAFSTSNGIIMY
jgi:dynein heavy chain